MHIIFGDQHTADRKRYWPDGCAHETESHEQRADASYAPGTGVKQNLSGRYWMGIRRALFGTERGAKDGAVSLAGALFCIGWMTCVVGVFVDRCSSYPAGNMSDDMAPGSRWLVWQSYRGGG